MVELFTARFLPAASADLRRVAEAVTPRFCLSPDRSSPRQPRCRNSPKQAPAPRAGFSPALRSRPFYSPLRKRTQTQQVRFTDAASCRHEGCPHRPYSSAGGRSWPAPATCRRAPCGRLGDFGNCHWIERRDYSDESLLPNKGSVRPAGLVRRASIELGDRLSTKPSSKGQRKGVGNSGPYPRLMRPRFLDPLSPTGDASSPLLCPALWQAGFQAVALYMSQRPSPAGTSRRRRSRYRTLRFSPSCATG